VGICWANCFKTHNKLTLYPLGKRPSAPSDCSWLCHSSSCHYSSFSRTLNPFIIIFPCCWAACGIFYILQWYSSLTWERGEGSSFSWLCLGESGVRTRNVVILAYGSTSLYTVLSITCHNYTAWLV